MAFGDKPYERFDGRPLDDACFAPFVSGESPGSERSFGSGSSRWSVLRSAAENHFHAHVAHGIGVARSVGSNLSDHVLDELEDMMPAFFPPRPHEHPRRESFTSG